MLKQEDGFSIIELMVAMIIFLIVMSASSNIFLKLFTQFKQQSKIAETSLQDVIGLETMRRDIENAGYGLPWVIPAGLTYGDSTNPSILAGAADAPPNPPRGLAGDDNLSASSPFAVGGSDYLVVKSLAVATSTTAQTWALLASGGVLRNGLSGQSFGVGDRVIVISPGSVPSNQRTLVVNGSNWSTVYATGLGTGFTPTGSTTNIMYGLDPGAANRPFNRADYYISDLSNTTANPSGLTVPSRCAPGTGVLVKAVVKQDGSDALVELPLLDCVADMQVVYGMDNNSDSYFTPGTPPDAYSNSLPAAGSGTAAQIRSTVKEVRVYILAHEGQMDRNYTYPSNSITVGLSSTFGRNFNLTTIPNWQNYRWKLYTLVVKPENLQ